MGLQDYSECIITDSYDDENIEIDIPDWSDSMNDTSDDETVKNNMHENMSWETYFERNNDTSGNKTIEYYEYKHKNVKILPNKLPMPPTDTFYGMFSDCEQLKDISALANWNTSNVTDMGYMFQDCHQLQDISALANWDISNVTDISFMFSTCKQLQDISALTNWDTSKVTKMHGMFDDCRQLQDISALANWDTSNVTKMHHMFNNCHQLRDISALSKWNVSNVKDMNSMFNNCKSLQDITPLFAWDISNIKNINSMFCNCTLLPYELRHNGFYMQIYHLRYNYDAFQKETMRRTSALRKENTKLKARITRLEEQIAELTKTIKPKEEPASWYQPIIEFFSAD